MKQLKLIIYKAQHSARQKCDAFFYYCEGRGHSFTTGRRKLPPFVLTVATRITSSTPGWMSSTIYLILLYGAFAFNLWTEKSRRRYILSFRATS
jgi:hypothetical protein